MCVRECVVEVERQDVSWMDEQIAVTGSQGLTPREPLTRCGGSKFFNNITARKKYHCMRKAVMTTCEDA